RAFPSLGMKLPSYGLSILATVAAFVWLWKTLFPRDRYGIALIGGASLLYTDVYMNTSFMVLRGGKFLLTAVGIVCITLFIRHQQRSFSLPKIAHCIAIAYLLSLLATMDEQIAALVAFIAGVALVVSVLQWRLSESLVIFAMAAAGYLLYLNFVGRW